MSRPIFGAADAFAFVLDHATPLGVLFLVLSAAILVYPTRWPGAAGRAGRRAAEGRLTAALRGREARLLLSTVCLEELAGQADVAAGRAARALPALAAAEPRLRAVGCDGQTLLYFVTVPGDRASDPPSLPQRLSLLPLLSLLSPRRRVARRRAAAARREVERLAAERARLAFRRDQLADAAAALEAREVEVRGEFAAAPSDAARRRVAAEVAQLRREARGRLALADVARAQHEVASSAIQALLLQLQGAATSLPDAGQLAAALAGAEATLEDLKLRGEMAADSHGRLREMTSVSDEESRLMEELLATLGTGEPAAGSWATGSAQPEVPPERTPGKAGSLAEGSPTKAESPGTGAGGAGVGEDSDQDGPEACDGGNGVSARDETRIRRTEPA